MTRRYTGGFLSAKEQATDTTTANGIFTLSETQQLTAAGQFPSGDFTPQRSLRFKATGSTKLYRTIASTGSQTKCTVSVWFKRAKVTNQTGAGQELFSHKISTAGSNSLTIQLNNSTDRMHLLVADTSNNNYSIVTTQVFRDTSAWYHLVYSIDSTQAIAAERMRVWINGQRVTSFASTSYPSQNATLRLSDSALHHTWGVDPRDGTYLEGFLSEAYFIDGLSLDASSFGKTHSQTGTWVPKLYTGTFGTNGSYLNFSDVSSTTSNSNVGIGKDYSGNGNYFISSNVTLSGGDYWDWDQMYDVPGIPSTTAGKQNRGNYPILNFNHKHADISSTQAGMYAYNNTSAAYRCAWFTTVIPPSGKYYWEVTLQGAGDVMGFGIAPTSQASASNALTANFVNDAGRTPGFYSNWQGSAAGYFADGASDYISVTTNDVINFAYDAESGHLWIGKNGVYYTTNGSGTAHVATNPGIGRPSRVVDAKWRVEGMVPYFMAYSGTGTGVRGAIFNFGQKDYRYTPPADFSTLCTTSMPSPSIKRPVDHFNVKAYTGNGNALTVGTTAKQTSNTQIKNSLRFNASKRSYLTRVYPGSPTSRTTMTFSAWVKPGAWSNSTNTFFLYGTYNNYENCGLVSPSNSNSWPGRSIRVTGPYSSSQQGILITNPIINDPSSWYNIVVVYDTTNITALERIRLYVNGVRINTFSSLTVSNKDNTTTEWLNQSKLSNIGITGNSPDQIWDGEMAEVNIIDGQALDPSNFGQFDANNNWVPKAYTGTYGNNGCYLPMKPVETFDTTNYVTTLTGTNYLSVADNAAFNFGTGSYTIEGWFNTGYLPRLGQGTADGWVSLIGSYQPSVGWYLHVDNAGCLLYGTNGSTELYSTHKITDGLWHHIAIVRNGSSTTTLYVDGKAVTSAAITNSGYSSTAVRIGSLATGYERYYAGSISNVRITKGVAVYTGDFTVPTLPLAATQSAGTNISAITAGQCSLLTCQSSTHIDNSGNNFTITNNNSVSSPSLDYITAKGTFSDYSGKLNHWSDNGRMVGLAPTVLTYGTPGTYTWTAPAGVTSVDVLVVAGGGSSRTGGGGAGGVIYNKSYAVTPSTGYTVTVGAGGAYGGNNGSNSVFATLTAIGGGAGASDTTVGSGGSGGGGYIAKRSDGLTWGPTAAGTGTSGQGFKGGEPINPGNPPSSSYGVGGGGGGAGGPGQSNYGWQGGNGGPGLCVPITGFPTYYGGGGAGQGGYAAAGGIPGIGGGGWAYGEAGGVQGTQRPAIHGTGGGGGGYGGTLGYGGNGIVIIKYTNAYSYVGSGANTFNDSAVAFNSPTDYDDGTGTIRGNYATLDGRNAGSVVTVSNGGLTWAQSTTTAQAIRATLPMPTGKWYWELSAVSNNSPGILKQSGSLSTYVGGDSKGWSYFVDGTLYNNNSNSSFGATHTGSDTISIAFDADTGKLWFAKNGTWQGSGNPATGANPAVVAPTDPDDLWYPAMSTSVTGAVVGTVNFGQTPFLYTPPSGFKSLNTYNLKQLGSYNLPDNFGNFVNTPDLVWIKSRSETYNHILQDTTRGTGQYWDTTLSGTQSVSTAIQSFIPNGFTIGSISGGNKAANNHVAMAWNKGKVPGMDIVPFQGAGAPIKIAHNLGQPPKFMMIHGITNSTAWTLYHHGIGPLSTIYMHTTAGVNTGADWWNNTAPTSTHFTVGANFPSTYSFQAYLWAEVPGFSKFGTYYGNGSVSGDGPYVYCGFRPRWIMFKSISGVTDWHMHDTARDPFNPCGKILYPNTAGAEGVGSGYFDILSNGFKIKTDGGGYNASGSTYMYVAFAENPFKYANAR